MRIKQLKTMEKKFLQTTSNIIKICSLPQTLFLKSPLGHDSSSFSISGLPGNGHTKSPHTVNREQYIRLRNFHQEYTYNLPQGGT